MSAEKVTLFRERAAPSERCGRCTHVLGDHEGNPCMVPVLIGGEEKVCPCPHGARTDVFLCQQMSTQQKQLTDIVNGLSSIDHTLDRLRGLIEEATGLETITLPDGRWAIKKKLVMA